MPPGVIHRPAIQLRTGASQPCSAIWATTAKTSPETTERMLPVAASTRRRPEQPRAMTMPAPNRSPPTTAPEIDPGTAIIRASSARIMPDSSAICVQTTAVEKARSQTAMRLPSRPWANSTTEARRQNDERCAAIPKISPVIRPKSAAACGSPIRSKRGTISMGLLLHLGWRCDP